MSLWPCGKSCWRRRVFFSWNKFWMIPPGFSDCWGSSPVSFPCCPFLNPAFTVSDEFCTFLPVSPSLVLLVEVFARRVKPGTVPLHPSASYPQNGSVLPIPITSCFLLFVLYFAVGLSVCLFLHRRPQVRQPSPCFRHARFRPRTF